MGDIVDLSTNPVPPATTATTAKAEDHQELQQQPLDPLIPLPPIATSATTTRLSLNAIDSVVASDYDINEKGHADNNDEEEGAGKGFQETFLNDGLTAVSVVVNENIVVSGSSVSGSSVSGSSVSGSSVSGPSVSGSLVSGPSVASSSSASPNSHATVINRNSTSTDFARKRPNSFASGPATASASSNPSSNATGPASSTTKNYQIVNPGSPNSFDSSILRTRNTGATTTTTRSGSNGNLNSADKRRNTITGMPNNIIPLMPAMPVMPVSASAGNLNNDDAEQQQPPLTVNNNLAISSVSASASPMPKRDNSGSRRFGGSMRRKKKDAGSDSEDDFVKVGTKVDKGHVNFVQMYDMLTGIRTSVSRCEAKPDRPLVPEDFQSAHKLAFDITGNELTPSSRYDFKFKDYAPWVFRQIRKHFHIDPAEYLISLTGKYVLSELGSPGKSGSFFYFSRDYRFIIKTIHHTEHLFFLKILQNYYEHISKFPNTLISRFFGLHRVKLPGRKKIHFVVMGNIFPSNKDIHAVYDLKGSTVGRMTRAEDIAKNPASAVQKDLNWLQQKMQLKLGPGKMKLFLDQMTADCAFLRECGIMDYSLLLAIHYYSRGNSENIRDKSLSVFEPKGEFPQTEDGEFQQRKINSAVRKAIVNSDPVALGPSNIDLPDELPAERKDFLFYQDEGGFRGTDEKDDKVALDELYYAGIIDILTPYNYVKKFEHAFKAINHDQRMISAVNPREYAKRFLKFMEQSVLFVKGDP